MSRPPQHLHPTTPSLGTAAPAIESGVAVSSMAPALRRLRVRAQCRQHDPVHDEDHGEVERWKRKQGWVALVGAGPGDPELITVRGLRYLRTADVVLYDRLVDRVLLLEVKPGARLIDVGKSPRRHGNIQSEIHALLIAHARGGSFVVRLKGGDPYVFGRGGEEVIACEEAGIPCEVVPGLSSAMAAPAAIGVPLTHRNLASCFAVLSGHRAGEDDAAWKRDLEASAGVDSLVILMAVGRLDAVCRQLVEAGRSAQTPAALVERATWRTDSGCGGEKSVVGTLGDLASRASEAGLRSPAALIVGPTVSLARNSANKVLPVVLHGSAPSENPEPRTSPEPGNESASHQPAARSGASL